MKGKLILPTELLAEFSDAWESISLLLANDPGKKPGVKSPNTSTYRELLATEIALSQKIRAFHDGLRQRYLDGDKGVLRAHVFLLNAVSIEVLRMNTLHIGELEGMLDMDIDSVDKD